jgi:hypothetical protein
MSNSHTHCGVHVVETQSLSSVDDLGMFSAHCTIVLMVVNYELGHASLPALGLHSCRCHWS